MRNFFEILIMICLPFSFICAQAFNQDLINMGKRQYENLKRLSGIEYPGDVNIDAVYYKLNLTLNYDAKRLDGIVTVSFKSKSPVLTQFTLDLRNSMKVDSVKFKGSNIEFTQAEEAKLGITLPLALNEDQEASVDIYYGGTPVSSGFGSFTFGNDDAGGKAIYTLSEPYGAADWWPCKDSPGDKADSSDVWITLENGLTAVSNGTLQEVTNNGNGTRTFKWKNSYPISPYLISIAAADYARYDTYYKYGTSDSMLISNYIWQNSYNSGTKNAIDLVADMIKILSDRYGPYPFIKEKYGQAQFGAGGGMEHQTITSLTSFDEGVEIHELAHQWFGDKVTCKTWNDIWLNEGFATYSECVYYEGKYGRQSYDSFIDRLMTGAKRMYTSNPVYVADISSLDNIFSGTSYIKGGIILHMLRCIVGDSMFFKILRTYNSDPRYAYNSVSTSDFQGVAESVSGLNLDYFFNEWIYGVSYPRYNIVWNSTDYGSGNYNLTVNLSQERGTNPQYFTMPVQLKIITESGDTTATVFNNNPVQELNFLLTGKPLDVILDPNNYILKDITLTGLGENRIPHQYKLGQNFPNPFNPKTTIRYSVPVSSFVTIKVYDLMGQEIMTLLDERKSAGDHFVNFKSNNFPSGVYFYRMQAVPVGRQAGNFVSTKKFVLLK